MSAEAAKQDAFEESIRLTNQFRALDEDEIEFLDSVNASTRAKEAEVKKDTKEQLDAFRKQQEDAEKAAKQAETADEPAATESWAAGPRKRKKGKDKEGIGGVKVRRTSSQAAKPEELSTVPAARELPAKAATEHADLPAATSRASAVQEDALKPASPSPPAAALGLGLGGYSSDED